MRQMCKLQTRFKLVLAFIVIACLQLNIAQSATKETDFQLNFKQIQDGIFVHFGHHETMSIENRGNIANIGFVVGTTSVAVIDPGGSPEIGKLMRESIRTITPLPISHVILTHVHPDHVFGGSAFADVPVVMAHKNFTRALAQRAIFYREAFNDLFANSDQATTLLPTDTDFDTVEIDLGQRKLTIAQHPTAHTDNDITIWDHNTQTLWASDLVFEERIPSLDGSLPGWLSVMKTLRAQAPLVVVPGHGVHGNWQQVAEPQLRYLEKLLTETRTAIAANQRLAHAIETVATDESTRWLLFEERHRGNITKAFTELEWE